MGGGLNTQVVCRSLVFGNVFCGQTGLVAGAFGIAITVDEFDDRHRRHVAIAEAGLQHADITALTVFVARAQNVEQFGDILVLLQLALRPDGGRADRRAWPA